MVRTCSEYSVPLNVTEKLKKDEIMPLAAAWMDLEMVMLSEASQTGKERHPDTPYMWNLKGTYWNTQTHRPK